MSAPRKPRTAPKGYAFTDEDFRWYWKSAPHFHVFERDYGDIDGRCFTSVSEARRVLWRAFQRDYDFERIEEYTHRPQEDTIDIRYTDGKELTLSLLQCCEPDDCYMIERIDDQTPAVA